MLTGIVLDDSKIGKIKLEGIFSSVPSLLNRVFHITPSPFQFLTTSNSLVTTRKTYLRAQKLVRRACSSYVATNSNALRRLRAKPGA